jgi:hydroxypyruvate reductase
MIARAACEAAFRAAVVACEPARLVRDAMHAHGERGFSFGLAIGKAALGMARGAGPVGLGVAVTHADDGRGAPPGWRVLVASHPEPDVRSLNAASAVLALVRAATSHDRVLALVSGGASALVEQPVDGVSLDELRERVRAKMMSGASIHEINALRAELSALKGGKLARACAAPITTLVISDVVGDDPHVVGSGPTVADRDGDRVLVVGGVRTFADALPMSARRIAMSLDVERGADVLAGADDTVIGWGEPTVRLPVDLGVGGRAQQLALELARRLRGADRAAFVAGTDGMDGPAPPDREAPAGAYVDGATWDAIVRAGIDPQRAGARRDAGTALNAVGALVVTGPTGINHADIAIVG